MRSTRKRGLGAARVLPGLVGDPAGEACCAGARTPAGRGFRHSFALSGARTLAGGLALGLGVALSASFAPALARAPALPTARRAAQPADGDTAPGKIEGPFTRLARLLRRDVLRPDTDRLDVAATQLAIGDDLDALARFVTERVLYEPAVGAVRGARGALAAGAGSDWDRALLLAALLEEAGYRTRFRVVERTLDERRRVVEAFLAADPLRRALRADAPARLPELPPPAPFLAELGVPGGVREILLARSIARWRRLLDESYDFGVSRGASLLAALENARNDSGSPRSTATSEFEAWCAPLFAGAAERVLLEVVPARAGGGAAGVLIDLSPEAESPGIVPRTSGPRLADARVVEGVPDDRRGTLTLRVVLEVRDGGVEAAPPHEVELHEQTLFLSDLIDRPLRVEIVPVAAAAAGRPPATWRGEDWLRFVGEFERFQLVVQIGREWLASRVFDRTGQLHDVTGDGRVRAARDVGGVARRGLGGMFGGRQKPEAEAPASRITEARLELELVLPGLPPATQSRLLFGELRPGVSPVYLADLLATPGPIDPLVAMRFAVAALAENGELTDHLLAGEDPGRFDELGTVYARMPILLHEWQAGRLALVERQLARSRGGDEGRITWVGGPTVVARTTQLLVDEAGGAVRARPAVDVLFEGARLLPAERAACAAARRANAELGAAETVLEALLLRERFGSAGLRGPSGEAELLAALGALRALDATAAASAAAPLAAWGIRHNDAHGAPARSILLAPGSSPRTWWSVEPLTGFAIGRGDAGEGQTAIEYLTITKQNLGNLKCFLAFQKGAFAGDTRGAALGWLGCGTGLSKPETYVGAAGGVAGGAGMAGTSKAFGLMSDALGAYLDVEELGDSSGGGK